MSKADSLNNERATIEPCMKNKKCNKRRILVSSVPSSAIDRSKIIVSLETDTKTYRTTLNTLTSRPSFLSAYLNTLLRPRRDSDAESVYSHLSDVPSTPDDTFNSIFHNHLTSSGLLPQSSSSMHIFLDRPSAP